MKMRINPALFAAMLLTGLHAPINHAQETTATTSTPVSLIALDRARSNYSFLVERDGTSLGAFTEVTGISSENEVIEFREGGEDGDLPVRKIPGRLKFANIVLKRGITSDVTIWQWRSEVEQGAIQRSSLTVTLLDQSGSPVAAWQIARAWPVKVSGPSEKSDSNGVAIETLEIAHEGLQRIR